MTTHHDTTGVLPDQDLQLRETTETRVAQGPQLRPSNEKMCPEDFDIPEPSYVVDDIPFASLSPSFGQRQEMTTPPTTPRRRQECVAIECRCEQSGASAQQRTYQRDSPVTGPPEELEAFNG